MANNRSQPDLHEVLRLCRTAGVTRVWLAGSAVANRLGPNSDIDLFIETDPRRPLGLLALGGLQMDLADLFGRPVHLTLLGGIPIDQRPAVLSHARLLDAA